MCVAVIIPAGANAPAVSDLEKMHKTNPHGAGIAWVQDKAVQWVKGLDDMAHLHTVLSALPRPVLLHFRLSSIGGIDPHLCHPFPVEKNPRTHLRGTAPSVMIHNGHWSAHSTAQWFLSDYKTGKFHSDTRVLAHLAKVRPDTLKGVAKAGQRFAILRHDRSVTYYGQWTKGKDGTLYSNMYWDPIPLKPTTPAVNVEDYLADYYKRMENRAMCTPPPSYQRMTDAEYDALMKDTDHA